jgi:hypothetical protein
MCSPGAGSIRLILPMAARIRAVTALRARSPLGARTVGSHLYRRFLKLGVSSRAACRDALTALPEE